jgi:eukaryotic-like serine/threonine-protein kinase
MSPEAEDLYERARALHSEARPAFLQDACHDDPQLREELVSLLEQAEAAEGFFERLSDAVFPPSVPDRNVGRTVGHYQIMSCIGAGGMGTVYRALDTRLNREVALKFLSVHLSAHRVAQERLLAEARAAASLEHPNVCVVHEIGETDDCRPYIVMALCEGETLKEKLRLGPLDPAEVVEIATQTARGLAAAHARGIIHRDVKPGNVMLGTGGTVTLLDFGLAKVADLTIAGPGMTPGTLAYMSPEQARGDPVDQRTDLWSLGVVFYEMLTGTRPFRGASDHALFQAILHDEPEPISQQRPETPEPLRRIVERLLRKDPDARYGEAEDLLADLAQGRLSAASRRRRALLAGAAIALVALVGVAFWQAGRGREPEGASIAVLPLTTLGADAGDDALADGMTSELIAMLAKSGQMRVIASTSVFAFKGRPFDVRRIGDSLRVSHILEGGLQKIGSRLRLQVRLVDARDGSTRWSETYDREMKDVFATEDALARAVTRELEVRLVGRTGNLLRHRTPSIAAYELYLRGNDQTLFFTDSGIRAGLEYFQRAIALDSTYAAAYAGAARMYTLLAGRSDFSLSELHARAAAAARKAVTLDDSLPEAHAALGIVQLWGGDLAAAETEQRRALALNPAEPRVHEYLVNVALFAGRPAEALAEARLGLEADPLSPTAIAQVAVALYHNGRCDEARAQLQLIAGLRPRVRRAVAVTALCFAEQRKWPEAIAALRQETETGGLHVRTMLGFVLARSGQRDEAREILAELLARQQRGGNVASDVAVVYAGLGDLDRAFTWLNWAVDEGSLASNTPLLREMMGPAFRELRRDPRFERVRSRLWGSR